MYCAQPAEDNKRRNLKIVRSKEFRPNFPVVGGKELEEFGRSSQLSKASKYGRRRSQNVPKLAKCNSWNPGQVSFVAQGAKCKVKSTK